MGSHKRSANSNDTSFSASELSLLIGGPLITLGKIHQEIEAAGIYTMDAIERHRVEQYENVDQFLVEFAPILRKVPELGPAVFLVAKEYRTMVDRFVEKLRKKAQ